MGARTKLPIRFLQSGLRTETIQPPTSVPTVGFGVAQDDQAFLLRYSRYHSYTFTVDNSLILGEDQGLREHKRAQWAARTDSLWSCFVSTNFGLTRPYRTRKSWLARRMRVAYTEALKNRGYAEDGTMLTGASTEKDLTGTIMFMAREKMMTMKAADLQAHMDKAISKVLELSNTETKPLHRKPTKPLLPSKRLKMVQKKLENISRTSTGTKTLFLKNLPDLGKTIWRTVADAPASAIISSSKLSTLNLNSTKQMPKGEDVKVAKEIVGENPISETNSPRPPSVGWSSFASPSNAKV